MSWQYIQLCNRVLSRLNEVQLTTLNFATAVGFQLSVQNAVNDALNDIYDSELHWPFLWASATQATTGYVQQYQLPPTYTEINWDTFFRQPQITANPPITAQTLMYVSYNDWVQNRRADDAAIIDQYNNLGIPGAAAPPTAVFPYADRINFGLTVVPDTVYNIYYEYYYKPTDLVNATDLIVIPDQFSKVVIDGATYYSYMFRDNVEEAAVMQKKFETGIVQMRSRLINIEDYMRSDQINEGAWGMSGGAGLIL